MPGESRGRSSLPQPPTTGIPNPQSSLRNYQATRIFPKPDHQSHHHYANNPVQGSSKTQSIGKKPQSPPTARSIPQGTVIEIFSSSDEERDIRAVSIKKRATEHSSHISVNQSRNSISLNRSYLAPFERLITNIGSQPAQDFQGRPILWDDGSQAAREAGRPKPRNPALFYTKRQRLNAGSEKEKKALHTAMPMGLLSAALKIPNHSSSSNGRTMQTNGAGSLNNGCPMHNGKSLEDSSKAAREALRRSQSPDWSEVPKHFRPLQGKERPEEFSTDLQNTWMFENNPDLTTPLGQLIFIEEINNNQMWENPEVPLLSIGLTKEAQEDNRDRTLAPPLEFVYTDRIVYKNKQSPIPPSWHCNCKGDCRHNPNCACRAYQTDMIHRILSSFESEIEIKDSLKNFDGFAYTSTRKSLNSHSKKPENDDPEARVIKDIFVQSQLPVFECNSLCGCGPECLNRTVGRGRREKLSLQKTVSRGWGVFTEHSIPAGRLITHYSGELITDKMSGERGESLYDKIGRTYVFDLDPWWINQVCKGYNLDKDGILVLNRGLGNEREDSSHSAPVSRIEASKSKTPNPSNSKKPNSMTDKKSERGKDIGVQCVYSVDAFFYGNVARFINHSCEANTGIVPIYIDDDDPTRPIFAMFSTKQIQKGKEITTSYCDPHESESGDESSNPQAPDPQSAARMMQCKCGAKKCRGVMFG
ncbi:hypothetical protein BY996DRAFT_6411495 [Phakopsora pachyrhizi]|nr:hypothetical protein BY996DRAFT_6411495 [Phakopsora pachyrhizi]